MIDDSIYSLVDHCSPFGTKRRVLPIINQLVDIDRGCLGNELVVGK